MSTKKIVIGGIIVVIAVITIVGSIGIVMSRKTTSPAVDAAAPNPTTLESLDVTEFGLSLNYDARYGDLTYAISDDTSSDAASSKIISVTNDSFTVPDKCTSKDTYKTIAQFVVADTITNDPTGMGLSGNDYAKVGSKFVGQLPYKLNLPVDDACYDKTVSEKYYSQQKSLYDSFEAMKENATN